MWLHPENKTKARTLGPAQTTAGDVDADRRPRVSAPLDASVSSPRRQISSAGFMIQVYTQDHASQGLVRAGHLHLYRLCPDIGRWE